jgi:hypothetical protein
MAVATAMVTGVTSLVVSFHIPENVSKVGDIRSRMIRTLSEFRSSAQGKSGKELDDSEYEFANKFAELKGELLKLRGPAAHLSFTSPTKQ